MARVSVIIPAYNAANLVGRAIESALGQTVQPLEILVIDDGSQDNTAEVVAAYPPPVRLLRKSNGGPASARNMGARAARGEWLAMLDADDWWAPAKLERQLAVDTDPNIGLIHGPASTTRADAPSELTFDELWGQNWIINSSALIRRSVFDELGGFNEDPRLISVEDYNLWLRICAAGWRIIACKDVDAMTYYSHGIGISSNIERIFNASMFNYELISQQLQIAPGKYKKKRLHAYETTGHAALYARQMNMARRMYARAFRQEPTVGRAMRLAGSFTPSWFLDVRRRLVTSGEGRASSPNEDAPADTPIFGGPKAQQVDFRDETPVLLVIVDAEEEFDWGELPSSSSSVNSMRRQELAQRIYARYGIVPTYAVDYPVASQEEGYLPLMPFVTDGTCEIGAQLHPWINPPIEEERDVRNTFAGYLPEALEFKKLRVLTETITKNFGRRPILYRAGRYGVGQNTAKILLELGYKVDCSVLPLFDLRGKLGPNYRLSPTSPYWFGPGNNLLEIPVTAGMTGGLAQTASSLHFLAFTRLAERLRIPGLLARSRLLDRIRLSPEGNSLEEAIRLTRALVRRDGRRLLVLSYHSPSLVPGNTPYVRTDAELKTFLYWIEAYLDFFFGEMQGRSSTPGEVFRWGKEELLRTKPTTSPIVTPA
jgi:glycosyltransferase involved in cell wall biosynthesis